MIGFTTGAKYDVNSWFINTYSGKLYGIGTSGGRTYSSKINVGDYVTVIREGTTIRFEKNKIDLGVCTIFKEIPNQPLFPAIDFNEGGDSVTLVNDY